MTISEPFIRRPAMTTLLTVSAILFGIMCYLRLPVNDLPAVDYPVIQVQVSYPGATPDTMANNVATPLEKQFMQIPGLELVTSQSSQGHTTFTLQFALSKSIDAAATDVQTAITQATGNLPPDLPSPPTFSKTNPNDQPIMYIALYSNSITQGKLYDYASTQVQQRISILSGVSHVDVYGSKSAVRVKADPSALATRNMTMNDLAAAIQSGTAYEGAGQFDGEHRTFLLQPQGQLENAEQYRNLIVKNVGNQPVFLRDVAQVEDSLQDQRINMRFWARGHQSPTATVIVAVSRQAGSNAVDVAKSVRALLPLIETQLPTTVHITPVYDRSQSIINSANDVTFTLYIAFGLVVAVIFLFLGRVADTLIPVVALPLSLLLTFIVMNYLGYSLDNLSLMALTLAIGFLVDDAIVFLENTVRLMEHEGEGPFTAAIKSSGEISFTIFSMTVSLAAVFLPLVFMPGLVGRIFHEFAITIIVAIFASGLVSISLTPMMCSRMLSRRGKGMRQTFMERAVGGPIQWVIKWYGRSLWFFLHHRWISAITWVVCLAGTVLFFQRLPKDFLPAGDSGFVRGVFIAQEGTSPEEMYKYQDEADEVLHGNPAVDMAFTMTSSSYLPNSNFGLALGFLKPVKERAPIDAVVGQLTGGMFMKMKGALPALQANPVLSIATGATANQQGKYAYAISGVDAQQVYETAGKMMGKLMPYRGKVFSTITPDLFNHTPQLQIDIRRDQASLYGVSVKRIEDLIRASYSQNYIYLIKRPLDQYQLILEAKDKQRAEPDNLNLLYIRTDDGKNLIPLRSLITWKQTIGNQAVNHINQFAAVTIFFNLAPGVTTGEATKIVNDAAAEVMPRALRGSLMGEAQAFNDTIPQLLLLMAMAVFVMYIILGILYESYIHPITVLSSLPVALVGGLGTLFLFHSQANLYAFIGMFMLMGIVKKNGIMLVDFALQRMNHGSDSRTAIHEASVDRFRPIIMTTLAALMGALPIALGFGADGASRRPLGLVIVGGLIVSQFITLYVTPALYLYLEAFQENVLDKIPFFRNVHVAHANVGNLDPDVPCPPVPTAAPAGATNGDGKNDGNGQGPHEPAPRREKELV